LLTRRVERFGPAAVPHSRWEFLLLDGLRPDSGSSGSGRRRAVRGRRAARQGPKSVCCDGHVGLHDGHPDCSGPTPYVWLGSAAKDVTGGCYRTLTGRRCGRPRRSLVFASQVTAHDREHLPGSRHIRDG